MLQTESSVSGPRIGEERMSQLGLVDDPMGYVDGMNDYEHELDNPINRLDPSGLQATGPATTQASDYGSTFKAENGYSSAAIGSLDAMLFGDAKQPAATISLPQVVEAALNEAVRHTKEDGHEWGGAITASGTASSVNYRVWGPVGGPRATVDVGSSFPESNNTYTKLGWYHTHPQNALLDDQNTEFSGPDIDTIITGRFKFAILTSCAGTIWLAVRLSGTTGIISPADDTHTPHLSSDLDGPWRGLEPISNMSADQMQDWQKKADAFVTNVANSYKFALYKRDAGKSGPLQLISSKSV